MSSPQKQEEQRDAEVDAGLPGNPLASQVRDAAKPEDLTTDALTSGDNPADREVRLAAHQDASRGSSALPGRPTSENLHEEAIAPDQGEPRAATTTGDEHWDAAQGHTKTQAHLAASEDVVRRSTAAPGISAAGHLSTERTAPDREESKEAITQADEPKTKYFDDTEAGPRRAARLDLEVGSNVDSYSGMPLAEDLSVKMREAGREEHDLEDQSNKRVRMSSASSAKAAHLAATPGFGDACVTFKLDSNESDMNLLRPKPPTPPCRTAADTAAAVAMERVTVLTAFDRWSERAKSEKRVKSHPVLPSLLARQRQRMKTPTFVAPTLKSEQHTPTPETPISRLEEQMKTTSFGSPAFASEGEKRAVATTDPTKIFPLDLEDLVSEFSSHKDSVQITAVPRSKTDHTLSRWN